MTRIAGPALLALLGVAGCARGVYDDGGRFGAATAGETDPGDPTAAASGMPTGWLEPGPGSDTGLFDTPPQRDPIDACSKVDFVFIVDNSGSTGEAQQSLAAAFPGFIQSIQGALGAQAYHIMVVATSLRAYHEQLLECHSDCSDPGEVDCEVPGLGDVACNALPSLQGCEVELGAGEVHDAEVPPAPCGLADGRRYMLETQPGLSDTFRCLAVVGTDGEGREQTVEAMLGAVSIGMNGAGACNEAFLRDDALLVVTLITNDESRAAGTPSDWRDELLAAKAGNETGVVLLGLVSGGAEASPRLRELVESFGPRGVLGSVSEPEYGSFFDSAVDVIDSACNQFGRPG